MADAKRVCFICGGKGHVNKNCPERTKPDNSHAAKMQNPGNPLLQPKTDGPKWKQQKDRHGNLPCYVVLKEIFETAPKNIGNRAGKTWEDQRETFDFDDLMESEKLQLDENLKIITKMNF